jgi:hypothetical protein
LSRPFSGLRKPRRSCRFQRASLPTLPESPRYIIIVITTIGITTIGIGITDIGITGIGVTAGGVTAIGIAGSK